MMRKKKTNWYEDGADFDDLWEEKSLFEPDELEPAPGTNWSAWLLLIIVLGLGVFVVLNWNSLSNSIANLVPQPTLETGKIAPTSSAASGNPSIEIIDNSSLRSVHERTRRSVVAIDVRIINSTVANASGIIYDERGYVLTAAHTFRRRLGDKDRRIVVLLPPDNPKVPNARPREVKAELMGMAPCQDIAVLRLPHGNYPAVMIASQYDTADRVVGSGYPLRNDVKQAVLEPQPSDGNINNPSVEYEGFRHLIRHDVPMNPGNSGGPLFNMQSQLIGINVMRSAGQNDSYAFPAWRALEIANQLVNRQPIEATLLETGSLKEGHLTKKHERHCYAFSGRMGDTVQLDALSRGELNAALEVYTPHNLLLDEAVRIAIGSYNASLKLENLPMTGQYIVVVRVGDEESVGAYRLSLTRLPVSR